MPKPESKNTKETAIRTAIVTSTRTKGEETKSTARKNQHSQLTASHF
jgi:hypothetical protein